MRCKPGDLAICVGEESQSMQGWIVKVIGPVVDHYYWGPCWRIETDRHVLVGRGENESMRTRFDYPDRLMMPLRPDAEPTDESTDINKKEPNHEHA